MGLFQALSAVDPDLLSTRDWFPGRHFFHGPVLQGRGAGLGMILIRSEQSRSLSWTGHRRVHASTRILTPLLIRQELGFSG